MAALSLLIDEYRRNWAIRYLREAESDLSTAERTPIDAISVNFAIMAMRKAQTSAYYSIGDPSYLAQMVNEAIEDRSSLHGASMKLFTDMELFIRFCAERGGVLDKENAIVKAKALLSVVSRLISLMTNERSIGMA